MLAGDGLPSHLSFLWLLQEQGCNRDCVIRAESMTGSSRLVNKKIAVMFPGQGSQFVGMADDLLACSAMARERMAHADSVLGYPLSKIMSGASEGELGRTVYTQPAIFVHSMMLWDILNAASELTPIVGAGHSLGEYSALCAAGVIGFDDALRCINVRAQAMDSAQPQGAFGMMAVVGLARERVAEILDSINTTSPLSIANINSPDQIVLSGSLEALDIAVAAFSGEKRTRCVMLPVSSAFHTEHMATAKDTLFRFIQEIDLKPQRFPVISNATALEFPQETLAMKKLLSDQVTHTVLWHESVLTMQKAQPDCFVEIGPGKVLTGLMKRINRNVECYNISCMSDIQFSSGVS